MYTTALSNLQEKLKTAVSEINKGNEVSQEKYSLFESNLI